MFQNDVFGFSRNNVLGFNNPLFGTNWNTWNTTPYNVVGSQLPWHTQFQMNTVPFGYNQIPYHCLGFQPQNIGIHNQGFLPFYGTNIPYQTMGYWNGLNQVQGNINQTLGHNGLGTTINPYFGQYTNAPWGFGNVCR